VSHRASGLPVQSGNRRLGGPLVVKLRDFPRADVVAEGGPELFENAERWVARSCNVGAVSLG
jgi:hypothetical protein